MVHCSCTAVGATARAFSSLKRSASRMFLRKFGSSPSNLKPDPSVSSFLLILILIVVADVLGFCGFIGAPR